MKLHNIIPHRPTTTTLSLLLALTAFILGCISLPFCNYASLSTIITVYNGDEWLVLLQTELGVGMWRHQTTTLNGGTLTVHNTCVAYNTDATTTMDDDGGGGTDVEIDTMWSVARSFGILALVIGGFNLLFGFCYYWHVMFGHRTRLSSSDDAVDSSFINDADAEAEEVHATSDVGEDVIDNAAAREDCSTTTTTTAENEKCGSRTQTTKQSRITSTIIYIITSFCQGLSLLFLHSSICNGDSNLGLDTGAAEVIYGRECSLSVGAKMGVASAVLWFMAGVFSCLPERREGNRRNVLKVDDINDTEEHPAGATSNTEVAETGDLESPTKAVDTSAETEELDCEHDVVGELDTAVDILAAAATSGDGDNNEEEEESTAYVGTVAESTTEYVGTVYEAESSTNMQRQSQGMASSPKRNVKRVQQTRRRRYRS